MKKFEKFRINSRTELIKITGGLGGPGGYIGSGGGGTGGGGGGKCSATCCDGSVVSCSSNHSCAAQDQSNCNIGGIGGSGYAACVVAGITRTYNCPIQYA